MRLDALLPLGGLEMALADRTVVRREHPALPLTLYNYTERCQYEAGLWNDVTRACRGLIVSHDGDVVARPFAKFFNWGQAEGAQVEPDTPCHVTDKLDGSLGILYPTGEGFYAIATRGAFESEQAIHATDVWDARYANTPVPEGWTLLFEIIYPQNRIVLDYGLLDDLVLLGAVEIATGRSIGPDDALLSGWEGPRATVFDFPTFADALAAAPRHNAEGLVILLPSGDRLKIKQEDYVILHRIVTGLNEVTIWEHAISGKPLSELLDNLPDEFHDWCRGVNNRIAMAFADIWLDIGEDFKRIQDSDPSDRKAFAALASKVAHPWAMFSLLDGKDIRDKVWKLVRPTQIIGPRGSITVEAP